jgi:multimeric flavodoxin WrbA
MRIAAFNGSPKEMGNTGRIMREVLLRARRQGAEVSLWQVSGMDLADCTGCLECAEDGKCAISDDMLEACIEMKAADVIFLGSPIYMGAETGSMKCFVDRLRALFDAKGRRVVGKGKKAVVLLTCGLSDGDRVYAYLNVRFFKIFVNMLGYDEALTIIVPGTKDPEHVLEGHQARNAVADILSFLGLEASE